MYSLRVLSDTQTPVSHIHYYVTHIYYNSGIKVYYMIKAITHLDIQSADAYDLLVCHR